MMTRRERYWLSELPEFSTSSRIPKIIHQTFATKILPEELDSNVSRLKSVNNDWIHHLYDDSECESLIKRYYGEAIFSIYDRIDSDYGAARADLFRYLIVYAMGGIYLDIKSYFSGPISDVISQNDAFIIAHWDNKPGGTHPGFGIHADLADCPEGEIQQWHVIASAGHPFLRNVIAKVLSNVETYRPWKQGVGRIGVLRLTGPIAYTQAISPILGQYPHRRIANPSEIGLHYSIAGTYRHAAAFKNHYSLLTTPIARLPLWARLPAQIYSYLKQRQQRSDHRTL